MTMWTLRACARICAGALLLAAPAGAQAQALATAEDAPSPDLTRAAGLDLDAQLAGFVALVDEALRVIDAKRAEAILAARVTQARRLSARQAAATAERLGKPAPESAIDLSGLAQQRLGSADRLALSWRQRLDGGGLASGLGLAHASGPIDVRLDINGQLPLRTRGPLALAYDGAAFIRVLPELELGAVARGPLGTLADIRAGPNQSIGPDARLRLPGLGGAISAETGWRLPMGRDGSGQPAQPGMFHWKLSFNRKL